MLRGSCVAVVVALGMMASSAQAQAIQAARSIGRAQSEANADALAVVVGQLTGQLAIVRTYKTLALQAASPAVAGLIAGLDQLEQLGLQALERRDEPDRFVRALRIYDEARRTFLGGPSIRPSPGPDSIRIAGVQALSQAAAQALQPLSIPPAIRQYVPDVLFSVGVGLVGRPARGEKRTIPLSVSTNLVGQVAGTIVGAISAGELANYFKDNIVAGVALHAGKVGKPSAELTAGLGEAKLGRFTFWPVLGFEQADTADTRLPRTLQTVRPSSGTWTMPVMAMALTWIPLGDFVKRVQSEAVTPIVTIGIRFPYFYPGNTTDALGALFGNKLSDYVREGRPQWMIAVDVPLIKVNPSRLVH
jgi:hypothetical protein